MLSIRFSFRVLQATKSGLSKLTSTEIRTFTCTNEKKRDAVKTQIITPDTSVHVNPEIRRSRRAALASFAPASRREDASHVAQKRPRRSETRAKTPQGPIRCGMFVHRVVRWIGALPPTSCSHFYRAGVTAGITMATISVSGEYLGRGWSAIRGLLKALSAKIPQLPTERESSQHSR